MSLGTLSVIIANYNHAHYLPISLHAILSQSLPPLEVIIIDDGSTDNSVEVIKKIAEDHPEVRLYCNDRNRGAFVSANRGGRLAVGKYSYFAASDDLVLPGFFEKSIRMLDQYPEAGLCSALLLEIGEDGAEKGWVRSPVISRVSSFFTPKEVDETLMRYGFWFTGQTTIYRHNIFPQGKDIYDPVLLQFSDHMVDLWAASKYGACFIPEVLASYRLMESGYASTAFDNLEQTKITIENCNKVMHSQENRELFSEKFIKSWLVFTIESTKAQSYFKAKKKRLELLEQLKSLRIKSLQLGWIVYLPFRILISFETFLAKAYFFLCRVNWNFSLAIRLLRSYRLGLSIYKNRA